MSSSLGPEDSMLSTPLSFTEGTRTIGKVTRTNFEQSMKHLNSPLRMPRGKVGPKIEVNNRRRRPESKMKGAPVRKRNEELENEVNAFIAGVATRLTKSAMRYSPPRCVRLWHALLACSFAESFRSHRALSLPVSSGFPSLEHVFVLLCTLVCCAGIGVRLRSWLRWIQASQARPCRWQRVTSAIMSAMQSPQQNCDATGGSDEAQ